MQMHDPLSSTPRDLGERPSALPYFFALTLFLVGNYYLYQGFRDSFTDIRFTEPLYLPAPGAVELVVNRPASFTIWNEVRTVIDGKPLRSSRELPANARFSVLNNENGETIEFSEFGGSKVSMGEQYERRSVGQFDIDSPGSYRVAVEGRFKERMFSIRQSFLATLFRALRIDLAWFALAWIAAPCLYFFTSRARSNYQEPEQISGMNWDGENSNAFSFSEHDPRFESDADSQEHRYGDRGFGRSRTRDSLSAEQSSSSRELETGSAFDYSPHDPRFESESDRREHEELSTPGSLIQRDRKREIFNFGKKKGVNARDAKIQAEAEKLLTQFFGPKKKKGRFKTRDEKPALDTGALAVFCHLCAFGGLFLPMFGNIVPPVLMLSISRGKGEFLEAHAKSSLNFQISSSIVFFVCMLFSVVFIGLLILPFYVLFWFVSVLKAASNAKQGKPAGYRFYIEFVK